MTEVTECDERIFTEDVCSFAIENMTPSQIEAYREQFDQDPFTQAQYDEMKAKEDIRCRRIADAVELATGNIPFILHSNLWREKKVNEQIDRCVDDGTAAFVVGVVDETFNILVTAVNPVTAMNHALFPLDNLSNDEDAIEFINDKLDRFVMTCTEAYAFLDRINNSESLYADTLNIGIVWTFHLDISPKHDGSSRRHGYQRIAYRLDGDTIKIKKSKKDKEPEQ